jgi:hypothetical protein
MTITFADIIGMLVLMGVVALISALFGVRSAFNEQHGYQPKDRNSER